MSRRNYGFDDEAEREPLGNPYTRTPGIPPRHQQYQDQYTPHPTHDEHPYVEHQLPYDTPPTQIVNPGRMRGVHPDSAFTKLRSERRRSRDMEPAAVQKNPSSLGAPSSSNNGRQPDPAAPPDSPPHRVTDARSWDRDTGYPPQPQRPPPQSNITPCADNFSEAAAGGMAGIAYTVAERNARQSGLEDLRGPGAPQQAYQQQGQWENQGQTYNQRGPGAPQQAYQQQGQWENQGQTYNQRGLRGTEPPMRPPYAGSIGLEGDSSSSLQGLGVAATGPGASTPGARTPSRSPHSFSNELYTDDPYQGYTRPQDPHLGVVNPMDIEDDGDDGLVYGRKGPRTSMLSLGGSSQRTPNGSVMGAAAVGGVLGTLGGIVGRSGASGRTGGGFAVTYDPVHNASTAYTGNGGGVHDLGGSRDKSPWLEQQSRHSRKWRWAIIIGVGLVIVAAIVIGILFGIVFKNNKKTGASGGSHGGGTVKPDSDGDLDINSPEIKALLHNPDLHKVFPGIDYTPLNTQYPDCLENPPSQNNITMDVAVLSQLTNNIRLYGTDCKQTEMTLHAIDKLGMNDTVKVWLGVWQDNNQTTNDRQLQQMYDILNKYGEAPFKGLIVANEILFRQHMSVEQLGQLLSDVRTKVRAMGLSLPVATSDLGDKWTAELAQASDLVMANIHPLFGGVNAKDAAAWTYNFWTVNNGPFFKTDKSMNIISETGWPSQGGTDCGTTSVTVCPDAAVAGIPEMNQFMADWVCAAMTNGTQYFWFEAFDEPWKVQFDTPGEAWEDHWGLMDVNRNLKSGVQIPDCGGQTVS